MNEVQHPVEVAATVGATATGWVAFLAGLNEVLITVSTVIAICVGAWTLYDKWRGRNGNTDKDGAKTPVKRQKK